MIEVEDVRLVEEFWPQQHADLHTARIEVWLDQPDQHRPLEVGRITAEPETFEALRNFFEAREAPSDGAVNSDGEIG